MVLTNASHLLLAATLCAYEQQNTYMSARTRHSQSAQHKWPPHIAGPSAAHTACPTFKCPTHTFLVSAIQCQQAGKLLCPPERRPICFCGRMICELCESSVLGMGWLMMHRARTTRDVTRVLPAK